jgi:hypothetical protein
MKKTAWLLTLGVILGVGIWGAHGFEDPVEWAEFLASWPWPELPHPLPC